MNEPKVRSDLQSLPAYKAGQKLQPRDGLEVFKLSSNENTFSPLPSVLDAINKAAENINRYPDPMKTGQKLQVRDMWQDQASSFRQPFS